MRGEVLSAYKDGRYEGSRCQKFRHPLENHTAGKFADEVIMKAFIVTLLSLSALASPLDEMNSRLETQKAVSGLSCDQTVKSDAGLVIDISCDIKCGSNDPKVVTVKENFVPSELGLKPGNGSNGDNLIVWGSLGNTLKLWSESKCISEARRFCGQLSDADIKVSELSSGSWKLNRFPGCAETSSTISPFDESVNSKRIEKKMPVIKGLEGLSSFENLPLSLEKEDELIKAVKKAGAGQKETCKHKVTAKICFGDCIDLEQKEMVETLGTKEPLGTDTVVMCADNLKKILSEKKVSRPIGQKLCEAFFWSHYTEMPVSCAALRGEVDCSSLFE